CEYDRAIVQRGDIALWITPGAIKGLKAGTSGQHGEPQKYMDLAIETALTLRAGMEERVGLLSAGDGRERVLPVQVDP
ncbi:MAG: hypothetical protein ACI82F_004601, partial [Planctomycetota bacterium]